MSQHSAFGRIANSLWLQRAWKNRLKSSSYAPDVILIGTDPVLALSCAPALKALRPKAKIVHWCFDLYPEAAVADGAVGEGSTLVRMARERMAKGYAACDLVADLGPCMKEKLKSYQAKKGETLTPWALKEPEEPLPFNKDERKDLFGEASLGLLYSGSFGRAHEFYMTLKLAQRMKEDLAGPGDGASAGSGTSARHTQGLPLDARASGQGAIFCYAARGSRMEALRKARNPEYTNVRFGSFAAEEKLEARLAAPDVHLVSLRPEWAGIVVPSKFFGALAVGRPVLFEGPGDSDVALWIKEYGVGWVLTHDNLEEVREDLLKFARSPQQKSDMFNRCHEVYQAHFSRAAVISHWDEELRSLLS